LWNFYSIHIIYKCGHEVHNKTWQATCGSWAVGWKPKCYSNFKYQHHTTLVDRYHHSRLTCCLYLQWSCWEHVPTRMVVCIDQITWDNITEDHNFYMPFTSRLSLPSASRSIISKISSCSRSPWLYPDAQLFPAPPPCFDRYIFSGLYNCKNRCLLLSSRKSKIFIQTTKENTYLSIWRIHNRMNYAWLQIQQYSPGNIVFIICLQLQR